MKFRYIGTNDPDDDSHSCTVFGITFERGKPQEVKDKAAQSKLKANPTFEAVGKGS